MAFRLYNYPPEDSFIGSSGSFEAFAANAEWCSCNVVSETEVSMKNKAPRGNGERPDWCFGTSRVLTPVNLYKVTNVLFFPWSGVIVSSDGGVFQAPKGETSSMKRDMTFLPYSQSDGLETTMLVPDDLPVIERLAVTAAFGGGSGGNYGHFLLDCISPACIMDELGLLQTFTLGVPTTAMRPWQARHYEIANLKPEAMPDYVYRVETAIFSSAMDHHLLRPNIDYREVRRRGLANYRPSETAWPERIYISRGPIGSRVNLTEAALVERLSDIGFVTIDPSVHPIDAQIEMFSKAEIIAGCTGAAFANAIYAKERALVIEIQPTGMHLPWVQDLCAIIGCNYASYFVIGDIVDPNNNAHIGSRFSVDVDDFCRFLEQNI